MTALAVVLAALAVSQQAGDAERVAALLAAVRGTTPLTCEMAIQGAEVGWYRGMVPPDADDSLYALAMSAGGTRVTTPAAVTLLERALDEADGCVPRLALRLLGRARTPEARQVFYRRLGAAEPARRAQAAMGLGYADDAEALPRLVALLADAAPAVREAAAWAIGALH